MAPRIIACTYVDHQETVRYPVEMVVESCAFADAHWLFGSDEANTAFMAGIAARDPGRLRAECLNHVIRSSADISRTMNLCVELLRGEADFILMAQADTLATPESAARVLEFCADDRNRARGMHLGTRDVHMYMDFWTGFGHTLLGSAFDNQFTGDGSWTGNVDIAFARDPLCIHMGYFTPEACARHFRQHGLTYGEPPQTQGFHARRAQLFEDDRDEFIRDRMRWLHAYWRQHAWCRYPLQMCGDFDPRCMAIVEKLGLRDDY